MNLGCERKQKLYWPLSYSMMTVDPKEYITSRCCADDRYYCLLSLHNPGSCATPFSVLIMENVVNGSILCLHTIILKAITMLNVI